LVLKHQLLDLKHQLLVLKHKKNQMVTPADLPSIHFVDIFTRGTMELVIFEFFLKFYFILQADPLSPWNMQSNAIYSNDDIEHQIKLLHGRSLRGWGASMMAAGLLPQRMKPQHEIMFWTLVRKVDNLLFSTSWFFHYWWLKLFCIDSWARRNDHLICNQMPFTLMMILNIK
jgi:hypothetical protein